MDRTRVLLQAGVIGPLLFIGTWLVEGATRPGYNWRTDYVSSLALGETGWVQVVNFLVWGTLAVGFGIGVLRLRLRVAGVLFVLYGVGLVVAGVFVTDPSLTYPPGAPAEHTTHGMIHGLAGLAVFTLNAIVAFVMARPFSRDPGRRGWAIYSVVTGVLIITLFIGSTAVGVQYEIRNLPNDSPSGLLQRITIVVGFGWIALVAWRLRRDSLSNR